MPLELIFLLFLVILSEITAKLVYVEPVYDLRNPNFTLGGLFTINLNSSTINIDGVDQSLAMICTLKEFNQHLGPFNVTGTFNGLIYDAGGTVTESEFAAMRFLEYNLKDSRFPDAPENSDKIKVGAIIVDLDTDLFFTTQPIFTGFPFTFLGVQFLSSAIGTNNTLIPRPLIKSRIVPQSFALSAASSSSMAEAIVSMLLYFNWTLVSVIYGSDTFGMEGQAFLQPTLQEKSVLTTCNIITRTSDTVDKNEIQKFADCLNESDATVVILWTGADAKILAQISKILQSKTNKKLIFITPGPTASTYVSSSDLQELSSSFVFKNVNLIPFTNSFKSCFEDIDPKTQKYFESGLFEKYWTQKYNCSSYDDQCKREAALAVAVDVNQVADSTLLIMKSIYLMQNNCSTLNYLLNSYKLNLKGKDYCAQDNFTASDIYQIINLVLYLGLPEFLTICTNYSGSLHTLQIIQLNQMGEAVPVGYFANNTLKMEDSRLYWEDDQIPKSGNHVV